MRLLVTLCLLGSGLMAAQESAYVRYAEPLRFAFAIDYLALQLDALELAEGGDMEGGEAEESEEELEYAPLTHFAGSLEAADPELLQSLEDALERTETSSETGGDTELAAAVGEAKSYLEQARALLVPDDISTDPTFQALLAARLALSSVGVAEAYEEAAEGETGAYAAAWLGLQRVKDIWTEAEADLGASEGVEGAFAVLNDLMPHETLPTFRDPEDAELAAHDLVFALEAATGTTLLPRSPGAVLPLARKQLESACGAAQRGETRLALEYAASAYVTYFENARDTVGVLMPELAPDLDRILGESLPQSIEEASTNVGANCGALRHALERAEGKLN